MKEIHSCKFIERFSQKNSPEIHVRIISEFVFIFCRASLRNYCGNHFGNCFWDFCVAIPSVMTLEFLLEIPLEKFPRVFHGILSRIPSKTHSGIPLEILSENSSEYFPWNCFRRIPANIPQNLKIKSSKIFLETCSGVPTSISLVIILEIFSKVFAEIPSGIVSVIPPVIISCKSADCRNFLRDTFSNSSIESYRNPAKQDSRNSFSGP